jgi:AraC-like DNA-binding protein
MQVLVDEDASVPVFMACAGLFRSVGLSTRPEVRVLLAARQALVAAARTVDRLDAGTAAIIARLGAAGPGCPTLHERDLSALIGLHPSNIGRHLKNRTGLGFREWTWAIRLRLAVPRLFEAGEPIKVIAMESGFGGEKGGTRQFHRCVSVVFGLSPRALRALAAEVLGT